MSEVKRTFLQGKMNKDLDERIVPNGQYVDALNIQVAKSVGSDVGAVENSLGNEQKTFFNLTNAKCIGSHSDDANQLIYAFVTADEKDIVFEYDDKFESATILLEATRINGKTLLNFQTDKLITGIIKITNGTGEGDLLGWTDDNEQPRLINIERAKTYGPDGFVEDDISLIKKPPIFAPVLNLTYAEQGKESNINDKFLHFAYAWRYEDGQMSALSPFTNAAFSPMPLRLDFETFENEGMQNIFSAVDIKFSTGEKQVKDIMLVCKEGNSNTVYVIESFNKADSQWGDNEIHNFEFSNSKIYRLLDEDELTRLFDNVPRHAKAMDVVGNRIALANYLEGYNLVDKYGEHLKIEYNLSLFTKDLKGNQLPVQLLTLTSENDLVTFDLSSIELVENSRLSFSITLTENTINAGSYVGIVDFILNKDFADVSELAEDADFQEFIQSVLTEQFLAEYSFTPEENSEQTTNTGFTIDSYTPTTFTVKAPTITYQIDNTPEDTTDDDFTYKTYYWGFTDKTLIYFRNTAVDSSLKTNRSYEAAIVYLDEYGRSTTALTSPDNTLYIPQEYSIYQNRIRINIYNKPPEWAKYFRFAVKQNKQEYQIIFCNVFYKDGLYRWIKLEGDNKDKVKEGDTLIVKSDLGGVLDRVVKVKILEVKQQPKDFLEDNENEDGDPIIEQEGLYMKIKPTGFDVNFNGSTMKTYEGGSHLRYPVNTYTTAFGTYSADNVFKPLTLGPGSEIRIYISFEARGAIEYFEDYDKRFSVRGSYASVQEWFDTEVITLGSFGDNFTRDYGFNADGSQFYVRAHRDGTASRKITTTVRFEIFATDGIVIFETTPKDSLSDIFYELGQTFEISEAGFHTGNIQDQTNIEPAIIELDYFNCYCLGNGVESYRYKDALNAKWLNYDTRANATSASEYKAIRRYADITYSEPYVESLGMNGLNNFNLSKANYKDDIIKKFGSIQHILARDSDLAVWQEDKVSRVLYGKELIVNSDGSSNLSAVDEVLGTQIPYAGEHGISRNPESIARSGNRIWFTDEKRNQVCRLSIDGITIISKYGMTSYFRDTFTENMNRAKLGAYDPHNEKYVLSVNDQIIYNPVIPIDCKNTIKKNNFSGVLLAEVDFGLSTGEAGVSIVTNKALVVELTYDGETHSLTTGSAGSIVFDKLNFLPRKANIVITVPTAGTNFELAGNCVVLETFTVVSIIKGADENAAQTIDNRYKWIAGNFASAYKVFRTVFNQEGGVQIFNSETGEMGIGYIPLDNSTILMESYKGFGDTGGFGETDSMKYLISDTAYTEADLPTIEAEATLLEPSLITTSGGETINRATFDLVRPFSENFLYLLWDYSGLSINIKTYIYIYFDSSGSMNTTLSPLQTMRDTILKDALLPLYDFDEERYDAQVQVVSHSSERTLHMLDFLNGVPPEGNVISLVFQDEAQSIYNGGTGWTINDPRTSQYNTDIDTLKSRLNSFSSNYYRGVIFQVETPDTNGWMISFKSLVQAFQSGTGQYGGAFGLADRNEFNYKYAVTPGSTPEYYKDQIVLALQELGFNL